ncbi:MFS transporter [Staphylococcus pseudintermedius]|nr:MFS transporter [Staphylococcus pseudintermedius]EIQ0328532.1 MFS transporter [Staphylococcus pseudintermedius]EIQ0339949.1 MFS transporter [Staphylococcus pseudintermedius]EIQ4014960.1 MFS transporter [Staphylococcus pseudintermedius]EKF8619919.1 MFS transporter [Staphylococcus pseudintermedius]
MFQNRDFAILFMGRLISNFGDSLYSIGTMLLVYSLSHSPIYTGFALFLTSSTALIQVFLSPLLDRINPKKYLIYSQMLQGLLLLGIPLLHIIDHLTLSLLLLMMFIASLLNQMIYPIQLSLLPKILNENQLIDGNAYFSIAYQGSDALFNALAGIVITAFGLFSIYVIDSVTFLINGVMFIFLSRQIYLINRHKTVEKSGYLKMHFQTLCSGLALWKGKLFFPLLIGVIVINFSVTGIFANLPFYALGELHYSLLMSSSGIGILAGSLIVKGKWMRSIPLGMFYILGIALIGVSWILFSLLKHESTFIIIVSFVLFLTGWVVVGMFNIISQTIIQLSVSEEQLGMAMGTMIGVSTSIAPLGALLGGSLGVLFGSHTVMILFASLLVFVSVFWMSQSSIRELTDFEHIEWGRQDYWKT